MVNLNKKAEEMSIHDHSEIYSAIIEARALRQQVNDINSRASRVLFFSNGWADMALGVALALVCGVLVGLALA